jgi:hypothetical protein
MTLPVVVWIIMMVVVVIERTLPVLYNNDIVKFDYRCTDTICDHFNSVGTESDMQ